MTTAGQGRWVCTTLAESTDAALRVPVRKATSSLIDRHAVNCPEAMVEVSRGHRRDRSVFHTTTSPTSNPSDRRNDHSQSMLYA